MRAIWRGTIGFGLVSIPVKMYNATQETAPRLHLVHAECGSRIQQKRYCPRCERLIEWKDVKSGYEVAKGQMVVLEEEELDSLPLRTLKSIDIQEFVNLDQVDPRAFADIFYLAPEETGVKPFWLLLRAMQVTGLVAIGKIGYREREHLALIRAIDGAMVLQTLRYANQIRSPKAIMPAEVPITERELSLATTLIGTLKNDRFNLDKYEDEYGQALNKLIEAKLSGVAVAEAQPAVTEGLTDLVESLLASIQSSKAKQGNA